MRTALVVDDNDENLYLLRSLLTASGYRVVLAKNGREALAQARTHTVDLAISDILMPIMDGFALCREWKSDPVLARSPFVFYTATYTDPRDEQFAMSLGADLFIVKPAEPERFLEMIQAVVKSAEYLGPAASRQPEPAGLPYLAEHNEALSRKLDHKLAELADANQALRLKSSVIDSSLSGIAILDLSGRCSYVNRSFAEMWGVPASELVGKTCPELIADSGLRARIRQSLTNRGSFRGEFELRRPDGTAWTAQGVIQAIRDDQGQALGWVGSCEDITEYKRTQEYLLRAQRLESLSLFARGAAHDFNNLLSGLYACIELARQELEPGTEAHGYLENAVVSFERARNLTQRLLTFGRGDTSPGRPCNAAELLHHCCALALSGSHVSYELDMPDGLWSMRADPSQLSQVFDNLILNARQAMPDGGKLRILARNLELGGGELAAGNYVEITFADQGEGIAAEVMPRIFDPYFTTKPEGSGLGLATSYAIVRAQGGRIGVVSAPGAGTTFSVVVPASDGGPLEETPPESVRGFGGSGRILVVDDDPMVRKATLRALTRVGYQVLAVADGKAALAAYAQASAAKEGFDLVVLEVGAGPEGLATTQQLLRLEPAARVLLSTTSRDDPGLAELVSSQRAAILPKPYHAHELLRQVRALVQGRRAER